ncbi:MAG: diguanylate cyclase [Chloroflexi bacterium]|nr:diguanylate cyclase [Chloroflexota bacterium]
MSIRENQGAEVYQNQRRRSLRQTLLIALLLLTLTPLISISVVTISRQYENSQRQIINQLTSVATIKEDQLLNWFNSLAPDLGLVAENSSVRNSISELMGSQHNEIVAAAWGSVILDTLKVALVHENKFDEIFIIDERGVVIISTNTERDAHNFSAQPFFKEALDAPFVQAPVYSLLYDEMVVFAAVPLLDEDNHFYGVLAGVAKLDTINEIMLERAGLGKTGETYLVNSSHVILTEVRDTQSLGTAIYTQGVDEALSKNNGSGAYQNYQNPVLGVYRWVPGLEVALLAEQDQTESFATTLQSIKATLGATGITMAITIFLIILGTNWVVKPLTDLTAIAVQATDGDLTQNISINRSDEIGTLADAFNKMIVQLRKSIETLESRVAERTTEILRANTRLTHEVVERKHAEEDLRKSQQRLSLHVEQTILAVIEWNLKFEVVDWNSGAERIFGYKKEEALGQHAEFIVPESLHDSLGKLWEELIAKEGSTGSTNKNLTKNGQTIICEWHNTPLVDDEKKVIGVASLVQDITARKKNEKDLQQANIELERLATLDELTQIANRRRFYGRLETEWKQLARTGSNLSLIMCDIDHFKNFNDTYGHLLGDECLYQVAQALNRASKRPKDLVARYGGEEFVILLPDTEIEGAKKVVKTIQEEIKNLDFFEDFQAITISFGITCTVPSLEKSLESFVDIADQALYEAKNNGRNTAVSRKINKI